MNINERDININTCLCTSIIRRNVGSLNAQIQEFADLRGF